ncbi:MAG: hypothetical protein Q9M28_03840 [Mariprofundaceae bacterium]|nr:hypothetical protein [Mariprofundaceae bacterium]
MLLIQGALMVKDQQCALHPELAPWQSLFSRSKKYWLKHEPMSALQWYAWQQDWDEPMAALLASKLTDQQQEGGKQFWVVTPYHATMRQTKIAVMPSHLMMWTAEDAFWLITLLNPMLKMYGIELFALGACIVAKSDCYYDVDMDDFAIIDGGFLPDRKPKGQDSLRFMCMMSEMQALLAQNGAERHGMALSGVWFWGMSIAAATARAWPHISTHQKSLLSLLDDGEVQAHYTDVDHLEGLETIPQHCLLVGYNYSVLLERSLLPRWSKGTWKLGKTISLERTYAHIFN